MTYAAGITVTISLKVQDVGHQAELPSLLRFPANIQLVLVGCCSVVSAEIHRSFMIWSHVWSHSGWLFDWLLSLRTCFCIERTLEDCTKRDCSFKRVPLFFSSGDSDTPSLLDSLPLITSLHNGQLLMEATDGHWGDALTMYRYACCVRRRCGSGMSIGAVLKCLQKITVIRRRTWSTDKILNQNTIVFSFCLLWVCWVTSDASNRV